MHCSIFAVAGRLFFSSILYPVSLPPSLPPPPPPPPSHPVLLFSVSPAAILQCYCSDCPGNDPTCYGKVCTKQTLFQNGVKISERWRCLNDSLGSCNISSPLLSYECCNSHDFCNNENYTSPFEENANRTSNFGCETTGNDSTNPSVEIMTNCTDSEATDEPTLETNTTTTYPSFGMYVELKPSVSGSVSRPSISQMYGYNAG